MHEYFFAQRVKYARRVIFSRGLKKIETIEKLNKLTLT